jgi:hypothetical protein
LFDSLISATSLRYRTGSTRDRRPNRATGLCRITCFCYVVSIVLSSSNHRPDLERMAMNIELKRRTDEVVSRLTQLRDSL